MKSKESNRSKLSIINASTSLFSQIVLIIINFISRTFFIKILSSNYLGINGLFTNILTLLSLSELGIGEAMIYAMYKPYKENDRKKINQLLNFYKSAYKYISIVVLVLGIVISFFLTYLVKDTPSIEENLQLLFLLYVLNIVFSYLYSYKRSIILVDQRRYIITVSQVAFTLIQNIIQILILFKTKNFMLYLIIQVIFTILLNLFLSRYADKKYEFVNNDETEKLPQEEKSGIIKNVKALAMMKIAGVVGTGTDNIIISKIIGIGTVGILSNYTLIINAVNGFLWSIFYGLTNSIGNYNVDSTIEKRRELFFQLYLGSIWLTINCCICLIVLINPFIEIWLGQEFVLSILIPFTLVFSIFVGGMNYPCCSYKESFGIYNEVKYYYVAYAVLNVFLSIWWGISLGLFGILLATSISRLLTAEIADGYFVSKKVLYMNPIKYFFLDIISIIYFIVLSFAINSLIQNIAIYGIIGLFIKLIITLTIVNISFILLTFRTSSFKSLSKRLKKILKI